MNSENIETMNELSRFVNETVQKLEAKVDDYGKKISELRKEIDDVKLKNKSLKKENDELKADNEGLRHKLKVALEKISKMEKAGSSTSTYRPSGSLVSRAQRSDGPGSLHKNTFFKILM